MKARTSRSELVSESASSEASDGVGAIGDLIGITGTQFMTTTGTTPGAARFITGTTSTAAAVSEAEASTGPVEEPDLSTATARLLEGMPNPTARAASAQEPSAATTAAERPGAFPHVEAPVSEAAEVSTEEAAVAAGVIDRRFLVFLLAREIHKWRKVTCGGRS